ncbi:MAG: hypothetical protein HS104_08970 [Polyangiaceae bacterium]|nr:hypothetical protein [Polyangiaceae bacterium]MCL4751251.1 hypothetical protein [Myxococcales bacterium]
MPDRPPLNLWRVVLALALLPVVLGLDRWAYWLSRSVLWLHLRDIGLPISTTGSLMTTQATLNAFLVVAGGLVALGTGPVIPLVVGLVLSALGYLVIAGGQSPGAVWLGIGVLAMGQGLAKPACFAIAAAELGHPREQLRALAFVLLYAVLNASALSSGSTAGLLATTFGARAGFASAAGATGLGALFAIALGVAWLLTRRSEPAPPEPLRTGRVLLGAAGLVALGAPYSALLTVVSSTSFSATGSTSMAWVTVVNPGMVIATSLLVIPILTLLHLRGVALPALLVVAVGLCLAALAAVPLMLARSSVAAAAISEGALGVAEVLVGPFAMARVVGDVPRRFQTLVMSGWFVVSGAVPIATSFVTRSFPKAELIVLALVALGVFVAGAVLLFTAKPLSRWLYAPAAAD